MNECKNHELLKNLSQNLRTKLESNKYVGKKDELKNDIQ